MKKSTIIEIIAALFILLFVYTAVSKLIAYQNFKVMLGKSPLIADIAPADIAAIVAIALPIVEIAVALLLFIPRFRIVGLYGSLVLMSAFTLYIGYMLAFTPNLPCSCGGVLRQMTWRQHLIFNVFFTALAYTGIWIHKKTSRIVAKREEPPPVIFT